MVMNFLSAVSLSDFESPEFVNMMYQFVRIFELEIPVLNVSFFELTAALEVIATVLAGVMKTLGVDGQIKGENEKYENAKK